MRESYHWQPSTSEQEENAEGTEDGDEHHDPAGAWAPFVLHRHDLLAARERILIVYALVVVSKVFFRVIAGGSRKTNSEHYPRDEHPNQGPDGQSPQYAFV
eukprot:JZ549025.1.p3 GENE.JZ549025.1~~JZ549025.1.p3  ORF type:complete len:101 (-),score=5.72 JZ549025.1:383-685(-)